MSRDTPMTNPAPPVDDARVIVKALMDECDRLYANFGVKTCCALTQVGQRAVHFLAALSPTADEVGTLAKMLLELAHRNFRTIKDDEIVPHLVRASELLSRIPSEEATEELLSEETVQACVVELFDLKSNVVRVDGPKKGSVTTETLVRTCLNAAAKRITRAPGAGT